MIWQYEGIYEPDAIHMFPGEFWNYRRMIGAAELPHLQLPEKKRERKNIEKKYGKNSPFTKSMVHGQFQASSEGNNIFSDLQVDLLRTAMRGAAKPLSGDVRAAGDVSGGGDGQVLMVREGTEILLIDEHKEPNDIEQADYWVKRLKFLGIEPWQFTLDGGGIGSTVGNYMELRLNFRGINRFNANNKPTYDFQFYDRYTELHWLIRSMLDQGVLKLPYQRTLLDEARSRRFVEMDKDKVKCEPKPAHRKRNKQQSPDFLDTLVYVFADFPAHMFLKTGIGGIIREQEQQRTDENEPTPMELKAAQEARGGTDCFSGLQLQPDIATLEQRMRA